ncbi:MAG: CBS domain-containing protein [Myxococcota bacterium]
MEPSIKPWFTGSPVSVEADASALEAHDRMVEFVIRHLPVVDAERRVVGVLSIDDLRAALPMPLGTNAPCPPESRAQALEWRVGDVMTHSPRTIAAEASLREAADCMADHRIGCLPVVDEDGRLTGLLSETDLLRALATRTWTDERVDEHQKANELTGLVEALRGERTRMTARLDQLHADECALTIGLGEQPMDGPEAGAELRRTRLDEGLEAMAASRLEAIDRALDHAAQGRLSICDHCGGTIPLTRLRALPGTTLCVACARAEESAPELEVPFERPPGGRAETGRPELGARVYTRRFGEGVLLRVSPFGTCGKCGDVEGVRDPEQDRAVCGSEGCSCALVDVDEIAVVAVEEREVYVDPAELRPVDPAPYD